MTLKVRGALNMEEAVFIQLVRAEKKKRANQLKSPDVHLFPEIRSASMSQAGLAGRCCSLRYAYTLLSSPDRLSLPRARVCVCV